MPQIRNAKCSSFFEFLGTRIEPQTLQVCSMFPQRTLFFWLYYFRTENIYREQMWDTYTVCQARFSSVLREPAPLDLRGAGRWAAGGGGSRTAGGGDRAGGRAAASGRTGRGRPPAYPSNVARRSLVRPGAVWSRRQSPARPPARPPAKKLDTALAQPPPK